jgi:hypothetical protein
MIGGEYRLIYFSPDPFLGGRIPVAALMRTAQGIKAVSADSLPGAQCTGGPHMAFLLRTAVQTIDDDARSIDELPPSLGPHFSLAGDVRSIPAKIAKPDEWLAKLLSAHHAESKLGSKGITAGTEGRKLLEIWGVGDLVRNKFAPDKTMLPKFSGLLHPVTHFVLGKHLLLLEPISSRMQRSRVIDINVRFGAYKQALQQEPIGVQYKFISYVLPGASLKVRDLDATSLTFADEVIDAQDVGGCKQLVREIRAAA